MKSYECNFDDQIFCFHAFIFGNQKYMYERNYSLVPVFKSYVSKVTIIQLNVFKFKLSKTGKSAFWAVNHF